MNEEKETQDQMIKMKVRTFIGLIVSLVLGTNSISIIYQSILENKEQIEYDRKRDDRINARQNKEFETTLKINNLKRDLKKCQESKK